jgi:methyl-accepting chemotaxis protein
VVVAILVCLLGFWFIRLISRPLHRLANSARDLASGELQLDFSGYDRDEIREVAHSMEEAVTSIRSVAEPLEAISHGDPDVEVVVRSDRDSLGLSAERLVESTRVRLELEAQNRESADAMALLLTEVAQASWSLSEGAEDLRHFSSTSLEQITATSAEMSSAVEKAATSTQAISTSAGEAAGLTEQAQQRATASVNEIDGLVEASVDVGEVIEVITEIADQTNLLSLNATIEAARAGEAGRGFGVVASEVKSLSQETAAATERIAEMIAGIQQRCVGVRDSTGQFVDDMGSLSNGAAEIAAAVEEQRETIMRLTRLIADAADQTVASSDGTSTAVQSLAELAASLRGLVSHTDEDFREEDALWFDDTAESDPVGAHDQQLVPAL